MIKLLFGAFAAFLSIAVWSRNRTCEWVFIALGIIIKYAGIVFELFIYSGIYIAWEYKFCGIDLPKLLFTILPDLLFILAFIVVLHKSR
ncbi:MAG: hypothetical protein K6F69_00125 [Treponema sp.]|nr:hypothetical protein [Treponema sp.]